MMETTGNDGNSVVRARRVVIPLETDEELSTRQELSVKTDSVLKSLFPLTTSMRLFGLYFSLNAQLVPDVGGDSTRRCCCGCESWNAGRIYASVMLVVTWLNALRHCIVFNGNETPGIDLFLKLGILTSASLQVVLRSTYYVASHTGSLDRVFRKAADLWRADGLVPKYSRRVKVVTILCWIFLAADVIYYVNMIRNYKELSDPSLIFLIENFRVSRPYADIIKAVFVVLELESLASWALTQAMNYIVMMFLYDQFSALYKEFSGCIGARGQFSGNFEEFRRRHQAVSRSVQEADRFLRISNFSCFCCQLAGIILVLFVSTFYRQHTVSSSAEGAFLFICLLVVNLFGLCLAAGLAIIVNHMVCYLTPRIDLY